MSNSENTHRHLTDREKLKMYEEGYLFEETNRLDMVASKQRDLLVIFLNIIATEPYDLSNFWISLTPSQKQLVKDAVANYKKTGRPF